MIAIASLIAFAEVTGERVTGKQELRIWAGLETTLIYCVRLSMNCIHAMHSIMSFAPDPAVEIVTAALLRRGRLPSLPGAWPAIPCMHHWLWKGVWLPVCPL